jgi:hypothetical protein
MRFGVRAGRERTPAVIEVSRPGQQGGGDAFIRRLNHA